VPVLIIAAALGEDGNSTMNATAITGLNNTSPGNATITAVQSVSAENSETRPAESISQTNSVRRERVLRAGFEKVWAVTDLDVYGNKSIHVLGGTHAEAFNISQRGGNISHMTYSTEYKPVYSIDEYSRARAVYQPPPNLSSRAVYSISGLQASSIP